MTAQGGTRSGVARLLARGSAAVERLLLAELVVRRL